VKELKADDNLLETGQPAFFTAFTGVWILREKTFVRGLTYTVSMVGLQMVWRFLKALRRAGDSQSGLNYSKE
jgi:hypothetical protein